ncbi:MAG: prepilin-type N-terminal cleavage/methylation domain-containing protein [Armatimonadota bacterium]
MNSEKVRAFTMVELLVVIAIIAITAGIAFPVFASVKKSAKVSTTLQNLKSLQMAAVIYQTDNSGNLSGTPEEMGLPLWDGTVHPFPQTNNYLQPWYAEMKSPFGSSKERDYNTFAIPSELDRLPVTWAQCTKSRGDACILYFDAFEPGKDSRTGWWISTVDHARKRMHGITLAGNIVTRENEGSPYSQVWWIPDFYKN